MAADGTIRINVSAGMDRGVEETFGGIEKRAERCGRVVQKMLSGGTGANAGGTAALGRGFRAAAAESDKSSRAIEGDFAKQIKAAEKASNAEWKAFKKANDAKIKELAATERAQDKAQRQETRNVEREADKQTQAAERAANKQLAIEARAASKIDAEHQRFARRTSGRAVKFMFPNPIGAFGMASRIGGDILRGAGVDMSIAGSVARAVDTQSLATQLSSQGYMKGHAGPNGIRVSAATLEDEARKNAAAVSGDPQQMLRAQTKFVDITGNLDDARKAMPEIGKLSVATGTDTEKMAEAWANVSRHIGEVPDKAEKVRGLMQLIAGQGRVGSIEIKDEAKDLGKIAAMADKYGGDRADTIGKLTTLAQLSKAEGGSASSAQAATSITSFTSTFDKGARLKTLFGLGLKESDIFNTHTERDSHGVNQTVRTSLKDPLDIIRKTLTATNGDMTKFGNAFKSVMSQRATNALVAAYNSGGGHNMGAVNAKINEFGKEAALTDSQVKENVDAFKNTDKAKAQEFQNALDGIISQSKNELAPALTALEKPALQAAQGLAWLVKEAASHPIEAAGVAVAGAIGRGLLESGFRSILEKSITNAMASGNGLQIAGAGLGITIAAATVIMHMIDEDTKEKDEADRQDAINNAHAGELENEAKGAATPEQKAKSAKDLEAIDKNLESRIRSATAIGEDDRTHGAPSEARLAAERAFAPDIIAARNDHSHLDELTQELADNKRILDMIRTGNLNVTVTNASDIGFGGGGPRVPPTGRAPNPGLPRSWD